MTRRFQFSLRALLVAVTATAVAAGVISWLPPQTQLDLANFVLVFAVLFGMLFTGVFAIAVIMFFYKLCCRAIIWCRSLSGSAGESRLVLCRPADAYHGGMDENPYKAPLTPTSPPNSPMPHPYGTPLLEGVACSLYTTNASISSRPAKILCRELAELRDIRLPGG